MANLKADLLNELNNRKYYAEMELMRLAQAPDMNYKAKVDAIIGQLGLIASLNQEMALADGYFQTPEQQAPPAVAVDQPLPEGNVEAPVEEQPQVEVAPAPAPAPQAHPGQSHGE